MISIINKAVLLISIVLHTCMLQASTDKLYKIDSRIILQKRLSQSRITSIVEDERGFMWFGTADGLNRYDGYTFKIFRNIPNDSTSLPNNNINSMVEDKQGNIWIGTNNGIAVFNPYTEVFKSLKDNDSSKTIKSGNIVTSCAIDKQNNIWYIVKGYGIYKINSATLEKEQLKINTNDSLLFKDIYKLFVDKSNTLWIGSYISNSVLTYNINNKSFDKYPLYGVIQKENQKIMITTFYEDDKDRIWLGLIDYDGLDGSLFFLDKGQKTFKNYNQFLSTKDIDILNHRIKTIQSITSHNDEIWFASLLGGIFKFKFGEVPVGYYKQSPNKDVSILCLHKSNNGLLWIGTNGKGIEISAPNNTEFKLMSNTIDYNFSIESIRAFDEDDTHYWIGGYYGLSKIKKDFSKVSTVKYESVYSISNSVNKPNLLWTGSEGGGLRPLNKKTNVYKKININSIKDKYGIYSQVFVIHTINDTLLLLGTLEGLVGYNPMAQTVTKYPTYCSVKNQEVSKTVRTIYKDRSGNILIGFTQGGIGKLDFNKKRVEKFNLIPQLEHENNYNPINCIYNDDKNRYWLATNNGLIMYNVTNGDYKLFTENDGLPNSHIYGILPDEEGNLWLSTNNGLSCYSPINNSFRNYDISDGLQNNEFNTGAYFKASNNLLFFGGISGFNYFNPKQIKQNSIVSNLVITGIKISNNYIKFDKQELLQHKLTIQPNEEVFTIEFAGLSFINSTKNQYKYKIKELNSDWVNLNNQHFITFNNMSHGTYTLEILASNNHGLWIDKPFVFTIVILPRFYESTLFKWILFTLLLITIFFGYKIRLRQITKQKDNLQIFANQQTANLLVINKTLKDEISKHKKTSIALKASNLTKDKFLSIMAHDIINPLGVILGFSDLLINESKNFDDDEKFSFIKTINITAKGLTSLISNLLQWSRLQNGTINPRPQNINFKNTVTETVSLFQGSISEKNINLQINISNENIVMADADMLSTILRNLISNAIKFTPDKGSITISSKRLNKMIEVAIIDTGVGIPNENIANILNPDDNTSTKGTNNEQGTGLGLSLVYEFVIMNNGSIWVESEVGIGSKFYFSLPIGELD